MIGKLKGIVDTKGENFFLLDVGGVCYYVLCSHETLDALGDKGSLCELLTEMYVQDTSIQMVGFKTELEKSLFRDFMGVQGISMRLALTLLGHLSSRGALRAVIEKEKDSLQAVPGVGARLSARILTELSEKWMKVFGGLVFGEGAQSERSGSTSNLQQQARLALVKLGYTRTRVEDVLHEAQALEIKTLEELLRHCLQQLSQST